MRCISAGACSGATIRVSAAGFACSSSASSEACQKNRYGLIVVRGRQRLRQYSPARKSSAPGCQRRPCPTAIHHQNRGDIGEERERAPLQNPHVPFVTQKDLKCGANDG